MGVGSQGRFSIAPCAGLALVLCAAYTGPAAAIYKCETPGAPPVYQDVPCPVSASGTAIKGESQRDANQKQAAEKANAKAAAEKAAQDTAVATRPKTAPPSAVPLGTKVTAADFGAEWPLTVSEGYIDCRMPGQITLFRTMDGKTYALTGMGVEQGFPTIRPLRKPDPRVDGLYVLSIPLIKAAQKLCP